MSPKSPKCALVNYTLAEHNNLNYCQKYAL